MSTRGFTVDVNRCTGCNACELGCTIENGLDLTTSWRTVHTFNPERRAGDFGASRMGMGWMIRETLQRGFEYSAAWKAFEDGSGPRPTARPELENIRAVAERKVPVIVHTAGSRDVRATIRLFHEEMGVRLIVSHATFDGYRVAAVAAAGSARRPPLGDETGPGMLGGAR